MTRKSTPNTPTKGNTRANSSADERLVRQTSADVRGDRGATSDARASEDTGLVSDEDFQAFLESEFDDKVLPTPPSLPGWHLCWLTSESSYDPIQKRMRLGYQPVRASEMPGFDPSNGATLAKYEGFVTCNEMVLCKLPEARYQAMMRHYHHTMPLKEEEDILERVKQNNQRTDSSGKPIGSVDPEDTGIKDMEQDVVIRRKAVVEFE